MCEFLVAVGGLAFALVWFTANGLGIVQSGRLWDSPIELLFGSAGIVVVVSLLLIVSLVLLTMVGLVWCLYSYRRTGRLACCNFCASVEQGRRRRRLRNDIDDIDDM
jgi:hypothetical protein